MSELTMLPDPKLAEPDGEDAVDHLYCPCDPDVALCGADVSGEPIVAAPVNPECPLCLIVDDLNDYVCARCGL
ncbi:hypothetical protein FHR83_006655 [Actinoplanes campanulatus]|uniref:Uncharacterized protein n=1 Tax=Actinoplanes campanulatus TaxID=113559 RepID=A0A7W5FHT3_9ACTN|nr:hypothetical protein [Actinoplanes campanulatus]MBB3098949.1 hypothetical protein [Actinoplanes campanulatus]GGN39718.1 hypothetical protein GCM10010109_68010 [Actinoplanes campanulatus]